MSDETDYPPVTDLNGIGEGIAERMNEEGFYDVMDVVSAKEYDLERVKGIGAERANLLIKEAEEIVDEEYFNNRQWNPVTEEYEETDPDVWRCEYCNSPFNQKSVWSGHQSMCSENPSNQ